MSGQDPLSGDNPFDLQRFIAAQAAVYPVALAELRAGRKRSHWMWFVFPQMRGLGFSSMAEIYGLSSLEEARAYLAHPLLGTRLRECTAAILAHDGRLLIEILGAPDDLKFRSSMTLFARAADVHDTIFAEAIERCCEGQSDVATLALIGAAAR
jgi:uncharacterized protein (DUF1810 family)